MPTLKSFNTFGIDVHAEELLLIHSLADLENLQFMAAEDYLILGGGSNVLLTNDLKIPVLKNEIKGREVLDSDNAEVIVRIGGGENWHEIVLWALSHNYGGIENLSLIPGTVGASPIQNIGAYGVEIADVIHKVHAFDMWNHKAVVFSPQDCKFGYRDSIFKAEKHRGQYFVTEVDMRLHRDVHHVDVSYGPIKNVLQQKKIVTPTIHDVSQAVIEIRQSKLPDPIDIGNSGSFFKNPIVPKAVQQRIDEIYDYVPFYPVEDDSMVKIPAGWLIEQCGWKGKRVGNTGNYEHQSLIIVNHGGATGNEIYEHAKNVRQSVEDTFGITLEFEVNVIG